MNILFYQIIILFNEKKYAPYIIIKKIETKSLKKL